MPTCQHCGQQIEFRYVNGRCLPIHPGGGWHCGSWSPMGSSSSGQHIYPPRVWQHGDFTHRTRCPECHKSVYFIRHNDGSVWLDELGWPWPKHACFDQPHTATSAFHDWSVKAAKNKNPNMGVVTCIRPSLSGASHFTEVTLGDSHKIGFFLAWMPPLESLLGALVVISREDHLLIHPVHGEIAMHDIVDLSPRPKGNRRGQMNSSATTPPAAKSGSNSGEDHEVRVVCAIKYIAHEAWVAAAGSPEADRFEVAKRAAQTLISDSPEDIRAEIEHRLSNNQWRVLGLHRHIPRPRPA